MYEAPCLFVAPGLSMAHGFRVTSRLFIPSMVLKKLIVAGHSQNSLQLGKISSYSHNK